MYERRVFGLFRSHCSIHVAGYLSRLVIMYFYPASIMSLNSVYFKSFIKSIGGKSEINTQG